MIMGQRIKYKVAKHGYVSVKTYVHPTQGGIYQIEINPEESHWTIIETGCGLVAASGRNVNSRSMKRDIRKALTALGVALEKETRKRA